jgi:hypothetical protein
MSKTLKPRYNYKFTFTPEIEETPRSFGKEDFNSKRTRPSAYVSFVYGVRSKRWALVMWKRHRWPELRKNGLKMSRSALKIERVSFNGKVR